MVADLTENAPVPTRFTADGGPGTCRHAPSSVLANVIDPGPARKVVVRARRTGPLNAWPAAVLVLTTMPAPLHLPREETPGSGETSIMQRGHR